MPPRFLGFGIQDSGFGILSGIRDLGFDQDFGIRNRIRVLGFVQDLDSSFRILGFEFWDSWIRVLGFEFWDSSFRIQFQVSGIGTCNEAGDEILNPKFREN